MTVVAVKRKHEARLLRIGGVVAVAADVAGNVLKVYVEDRGVCAKIPRSIEGIKVECIVVGRVRM